MSNFSNSEHHQITSSSNNPNFFNNDALNGIEGFANSNANDTIDQSWGFVPNQYDVSGSSAAGWPNNVSQHLQQASTFRPGARPDQTISSSSFPSAFTGSAANSGYGANVTNIGRYPQQHYDPSTIAPSHLSNAPVNIPSRSANQPNNNYFGGNNSTISPEALQSRPQIATPPAHSVAPQISQNYQNAGVLPRSRPAPDSLPRGDAVGNFTVLNTDRLRQVSSSRALAAFLDVGQEPYDYPISKSSIPLYFPRKSRNEIKRLLASDSRLTAKLNKKLSKKSGLSGTQSIPAQLDSTGKLTTQGVKKEQESSSDETSSEDSEFESSDDESRGPPIPATRPVKPRDATRYDTIKCLWRPESKPVSAQDIRDGLKGFHEILTTIKDRWKSDSNAVKDAEATKKTNEVPLLKERVKSQLDMLEAALKAASELGHPDILDHFGASLPSVGSMAVFLQDRAKEQDYSSPLVVALMQFLAKCKLIDSGILEKSNVGKLLSRFSKRGDEKVKALARRVENNAAVTTKKKKEAPKPLARSSSGDKDTKSESGPKSPQSTAGVKRPRVSESGAGDQPAKKMAGKAGDASGARKATTPGAAPANKAATPAVAKSSSFISSLQSAKRPTVKAAGAGAGAGAASSQAKPPPTKSASESKPAAASAGGFSFASVLADVERTKDEKPKEAKVDEGHASETPEQRAKRLRRESRRSLRVSFKPEDALVEVRIFEHDPEEELGHDASQMRDVNDVGNEGKMFKLHQQHHDMMDIDDDEEMEQGAVEQSWRDWKQLRVIDFQDVAEKVAENFIPYGGSHDPQSPEKTAQEEREASTLVAVYSDPSQIPPSPHEPSPSSDNMEVEAKEFGTPDAIDSRIEEVKKVQPRVPERPQSSTSPDISAILSMLNQGGTPAAPTMQQSNGQSAANLANLISQIPNVGAPQPYPAAAPMLPSQQPIQPPAAPDMSAILSSLNAAQNQQPQQPQATNTTANQQPQVDISSLLATLGGAQQTQNAAPPPPPTMSMPPFPSMPGMQMPEFNAQDPMWQAAHQFASSNMPNMENMWSQQPQTQQQDNGGGIYENEARKRWRESNDEDADDPNGFKRQKPGKKAPNPKSFFTQFATKGMDPNAPAAHPESEISPIRWTLAFLFVGAAWGLTTPFMRKAAVGYTPPDRGTAGGEGRNRVVALILKAFWGVWDVLR
ncbi:MAG: hypothetical protein Q9159_002720 [Coniocarpon cinnabarinum]